METRGFFIRRKGTDGYQFGFKPTLKKVVNDRRASLDEDEVLAESRKIVDNEFLKGKKSLSTMRSPRQRSRLSTWAQGTPMWEKLSQVGS